MHVFPPMKPSALLLVLTATVTGACQDQPSDNSIIGPDNSHPSAYYEADPEIDQGDTYYLAEVVQEGSTTVETEGPITDPVTGEVSHQLTAHHETETQRVEGGYDYYGQIIQVLDQTDAVADPLLTPVNLTRRTRSVEDQLTRYDEYRQPVANELEPAEMMGTRGPSHEQITDGLVLDASSVDALPELTPAAEPLVAAAGPRATIRRARPDEVQITNQIEPEEFGLGHPVKGADQPEQQGQVVRTYRRRGQKYLLEQVEATTIHKSATARVRQRQVSRIRMLRLHENPQKDRERREKRRGITRPASMMPLASTEICPMSMESTSEACEPPPPDDEPPPPYEDPCPAVQSGANVLFQHGILSDGSTWWRMDPWIRCSFETNMHIRPSINWYDALATQREELRFYLPTAGAGTVLIGHSNGGLVSRSLAQWAQMHRPGSVRGVVTLDSPNKGAIVAVNIQVIEGVLFSLAGNAGIAFDIVSWHPFYEDDVPFSPFLIRTNGFDENFTRVGIQTHTPKRWVLWRIGWTPSNCNPESSCGERAVAARIQEKYDRHRHYARFWYRPWQSGPAVVAMMGMNGIDAVWHTFTAPHGFPSDGFVHGQGQVYPRANRNRLIQNGDSHVGVTRSPFVRAELEFVLEDQSLFAIPRRIRP